MSKKDSKITPGPGIKSNQKKVKYSVPKSADAPINYSKIKNDSNLKLAEEMKIQNLISNLPGFIYRCLNDKNWTMEFISEGCKQITGYAPKDFINNNKIAFNEIIHPDYQINIWKQWQKILKNRAYFEFEYPIISKSKKIKWVWERGRGVYSPKGKLLYLEGYITDITKRKLTDESLRLKNIVFESSISANSIADIDGKITQANKAFLELWGYKKLNEVIGKKISDFIDDQYEASLILNRLVKKGKWEGEFIAKRKNSTKFIAQAFATTIVDEKNNIIGFQSSVLDISIQHKAENKLKENELRYRSLFDNSPDAIFLADPKTGIIKDVNKSALILLKKNYSEVIGLHQSELHPKRMKAFTTKSFNVHASKKDLKIPVQTFLVAKNGDEIPVEVIAGIINIDGNELLQGVFRDIRDRIKVENALKESENKFRFLFEHSKDAMLLLDNESFFDCNNAAVEILGCSSKELILSKRPADLSPRFQPDGELSEIKSKRMMKEAFKNGSARFDWMHKKINGDELPIEVMLTVIPLEGKQILFTVWRDISERIAYEAEIKKNNDRMQLLVEGTPHLFFYVKNLKGKLEYVSPSVMNITGYTTEHWLNQSISFTVNEKFNKFAKKNTSQKIGELVNQKPTNVEIKHANGSRVLLEIFERPIFNSGKIVGFQGVAHDVSERVRFEENLKQSELNYRKLFDSVSESIYIQDANNVFLDVNDGAVNMYGYDKNTLIGKTPEFVSAPFKNDLTKIAALVSEAFNGKKQQFEFWGKRKNGEEFLKDVRLYPGTYFDKKVIIAIANDITQKRKAEQLLKDSEERYKLIAENTGDSIAVLNLDLKFTYLSPSVKKLLGYTPEELLQLGIKTLVSDETFNEILRLLYKEMELEQSGKADPRRSRIIETEQIHKAGHKVWVEGTVSFIRDQSGLPIGILAVSRDITQRKKVEAQREAAYVALKESEDKLIKSEERYRIISSLTSDYLFSTKVDSHEKHEVEWIAGSFEKITGYTLDEYKSIGGWVATLHPDELESDEDDLKRLENNEKITRDIRTIHKNGNLVWVRSYAHPIWDYKKNKLIGIYGAVEDITLPKRNEILQKIQYNIANAVVTSKNIHELFILVRSHLAAIINVKNFFIALYDDKTGLLSSDIDEDEIESISEWPAEGSMTGYVIEQRKSILLSKKQINELIANGTAGMIGVIPEVWLGVPFIVSGEVIGVLVVQSYDNPNAYDDNSVEILEIVAHELSIYIKHKKAEEEALKLTTAIVQSPVSIVITDPKGNIEYVNPKFTEVSGYSFEEAIGNNPKILKSNEHSNEFFSVMWRTISSGEKWQGELRNKKKNGELYWESAIISPIVNNQGLITNFVAVKEDITDKKKMIEELIQAKEKAEEMNRVKSNFFANMSHELRTPMVGILGFSEVLMNEFKENPDYFHMINSIYTSGQRLLETLNLILNLSKLDAAKVEPNFKMVNVVPLLNESFNFFQSAALKKNLHYNFNCRYSKIVCEIDTLLFQSVINNLLNNAIKFTDKGSIELEVIKSTDSVMINIADTGVGISEEKQNLIWEEFRQASEGYNRGFEGTGLGLTISKKYTELMKGNISVKSKLGSGTVFTVSFPFSTSDVLSENSHTEENPDFQSSLNDNGNLPRLLYVEDDDVAVKYVKALTKNLYDIDAAMSADEALTLVKDNNYNAILMDINLHRGMDGVELTRLIKKIDYYKKIPIIAITAFAMGHEKEEFLSKGLDYYLSKPFSKNQLLRILEECLKSA